MAELTESHESVPSADSTEQADEPQTRSLTLEPSGLALSRPLLLPNGDDGLLARGARLDNYEIVAKLGGGGMGQVYRVRHVRLDREFALKIISSRHISPEAVQRFEREMKAAGRTSHPNVILATDAGESQGLHYLVMELVPGTHLAALVKRIGPLPVADACEVIRQAALGLQAVHEAGLVHRDIKPHNLMLTPEASVKVLDLGLARLVGEAGDTLTENGSMGGTADYMAPEQAVDLHSVTIAADLYSLGCTLYCLLAGRPPFGDDRHSNFASKLMAHSGEPVPPIATIRPELAQRPELLRLLDRMLAKSPAARPSEPRAVAEALAPLALGHDLTKLFGDRPHVKRDGAPASALPSHRPVTAAGGRGVLGLIARLITGRFRISLRITVSVVVTLGLMVGLFALWPTSQESLFREAEVLMASRNPSDWNRALRDYVDPLDRKYPDNSYKAKTRDWRDRILIEKAEGRSATLGSAVHIEFKESNTDAERQYVECSNLARKSSERGDDLTAAAAWDDLARRIREDDPENRQWRLLAHKRAADLRKDVATRRAFVESQLRKIADVSAAGHFDQAATLRESLLKGYGKYTDLADLLGPD